MAKRVLFLSNGHGEDLISATLISELKKLDPQIDMSAMPLVGEGKAFESLGIKLLGPRKPMPSGGFIYHNLGNLIKDLTSGLVGNTLSQIGTLRKQKKNFDLVVAIGDIVVIVGAVLTGAPFLFVGCAKSSYYDYNYTPWEKFLLKKYCRTAFPRDQLTTDNLKNNGIKAVYVGNPMMDGIKVTGELPGVNPSALLVAFLPGTRDDAYLNIEDLVRVARKFMEFSDKKRPIEFLVALSDNLDFKKADDLIPPTVPMKLFKNKFGDILHRAEIVVGLSGTGNEQAVGLGKPLICFPTRGVQHTKKFVADKKQLLGDSLIATDPDPSVVAQEMWRVLKDKDLQDKMRAVGRERMGVPGAARKIAEAVVAAL